MVITPLQLWNNYDRTMLPLNKSLVSSSEKDGVKTSYYYFNGEAAADGVTRVYAKLAEPTEKTDVAILVMDDLGRGIELFDCEKYLSAGFSVLVVDYTGFSENAARYTIYPKSLCLANAELYPDTINSIGETVKVSCRYIWATDAMRGITLLEELGYEKIAMIGIGDGGHQVYKAAFFEKNLICAAVKYSGTLCDLEGELDDNELSFKTALSNISYVPYVKCPILIQATSNEQNSGFDELNEIFSALEQNEKLIAVSPRCDKMIEPAQKYNIPLFFSATMKGEKLPAAPTISFNGSEKSLYAEISADDSLKIDSAQLYVAYSQKVSAYRNWHNQPLEKIGGNEYLSKIPVYSVTEPVYAFVNIRYENSLTVSSKTISVIPQSLRVEPVAAPAIRRLYDNEMGTGNWIILQNERSEKSDDATLTMENGPFDISGVTCSTNKMATLTLADSRFKGTSDSVLQLVIYSPENQILTFSATSSADFTAYYCQKQISPVDNWTRFSLSPQDFRSKDGILQNLGNIITFEIDGESKFLINSVLWV